MRTESRRSTQKAVSLKVHHAASTLGGEGQARSADSPVDTDGNRCRHGCCMYVLVVVDVLSAVLLRGDGRKARSKLAQKQLSGMDDCTDQQAAVQHLPGKSDAEQGGHGRGTARRGALLPCVRVCECVNIVRALLLLGLEGVSVAARSCSSFKPAWLLVFHWSFSTNTLE